MQGVVDDPMARPRTRFERLTEKHTPQRPNWAMADDEAAPPKPSSPSTTTARRQIRRMPNTNLKPIPPWELEDASQSRESAKRDSIAVAIERTGAQSGRPPFEHPAPQDHQLQSLNIEERWQSLVEMEKPQIQQPFIHPSRAAQITHTYQPIVNKEPPITRGPVDSGWNQRQIRKAGIPINAGPTTLHQTRPKFHDRQEYIHPETRRRDIHMHQFPRKSQDLRKVASSPNNQAQTAFLMDLNHFQGSLNHHTPVVPPYGKEIGLGGSPSMDMTLNQLQVDFGSISIQNEGLLETARTTSRDNGTCLNGPVPVQNLVNHHFNQNTVRPMHSAPELVQRPPSDPDLALLQVHRPRPIRATEYVGVFPEQPPAMHRASERFGQPSDRYMNPANDYRALRRVPRFSEMTTTEMAQMQPMHMYDHLLGADPARTRVDSAFPNEAFELWQKLAEERPAADSSPEFYYEGIDSQAAPSTYRF
ncbi:hypothetical protein M408DRAFT_274410 [Serendipita vermifera MAFF 305830]|uniref:Uncharacterized protein n=1 Tax=Serendipita vermifera MAFF 305830 TaxID=933852 RepID=A0A0C3B2H6_SERVB|nr:hypothetical protein M408DRAFT_274410 [Serendipita vermifera MAFF 305830]